MTFDLNDTLKTTGEVILSLSGIATILYAIITYRTLLEIKRQRETSYLPDIYIDSFAFEVFGSFLKVDGINYCKFRNAHIYTWDKINNEELSQFMLYKFHNIGLGSAKNVTVTWEYDFEAAFKQIESMLPEHFKLVRETSRNIYHFVAYDNTSRYYDPIFIDEITPKKKPFIPPIKTDVEVIDAVPRLLYRTYFYYVFLKNDVKDIFYDDCFKMPKPIIHIAYQDLSNNKHKKSFNVSITIANSKPIISRTVDEIGVITFNIEEIKA